LALGQKPDAFFIACSDSRVVPNLFASTNPGDLFVLRNVGNLVPSPSMNIDVSTVAAMEFSLFNLPISNIIVCGHSECGAMKVLCESSCNCEDYPHLSSWLNIGKFSLE